MQLKRVVVCLLVLLSIIPLWAQNKRRMTVIDLLNVPNLTDANLSPDGTQVVFRVAAADWKADKRVGHIWRVRADGTGQIQLTNGADGEQEPRWSPDEHQIAFAAKRGDHKQEQIYLLSPDGGEARRLTTHEAAVSNIAWSPDGKSIYFLAADPKTKEEKARDDVKDDVFAMDENFKQRHLWTAAVDSGSEKRLTSGDYSILSYNVSRSGKKIAFPRAPSPQIDDADKGEVWIMGADGTNSLQLTRNNITELGAVVSPDDSRVLYLSET